MIESQHWIPEAGASGLKNPSLRQILLSDYWYVFFLSYPGLKTSDYWDTLFSLCPGLKTTSIGFT